MLKNLAGLGSNLGCNAIKVTLTSTRDLATTVLKYLELVIITGEKRNEMKKERERERERERDGERANVYIYIYIYSINLYNSDEVKCE